MTDMLTDDSIRAVISKTTDISLVTMLRDSIDVDIENVSKGSHRMIEMQAQMRGISVPAYLTNKIEALEELKEFMSNRIVELEKDSAD